MKKVINIILTFSLIFVLACKSLGTLQEAPRLCLEKTEFCTEKNLDALRSEALNIHDHLVYAYKVLGWDLNGVPKLPAEVIGIDASSDSANVLIYMEWNKPNRRYFEELKKKYDNFK